MRGSLWAMLTAALASVALASGAAAADKVTLGYGITSDYLAVFVAKEAGIFEKNGLDVTMVSLASASLAPPALVSGSMTIAQTTPSNVMLANEGGLDLVVVAGVARLTKAHPRTSLITRAGVTVTKPADLKDKTVAVPGINAAMDLVLKRWILDAGIPLNEVKIVETPFAQMGDRLQSGQLDAAILIEPLLTRVLEKGQAQRSVDVMSTVNPDLIAAVFGATREWATTHRPAVAAFRASLTDAKAFIEKDPNAAWEMQKKYLQFAANELPEIAIDVEPRDLQFYADVLRQVGQIKQPVDAGKLVFK